MEEIQKAKLGIILNSIGFCVGLCTLVIDVIPVIAVGAIIFCPVYAGKSLGKYRKLKRLQLKGLRPLDLASPPEFFGL